MLMSGTWMALEPRFLYLISFLMVSCRAFTGCPKSCFCNDGSFIVYCSRRGLDVIPDGIPVDAKQINLNANVFQMSVLRRSNFSDYPLLEHLYLSECGLETIQVETFVDLQKLKWLDLSNNRIRMIQDYTFRGSSLQHLFLNGNHNIQIRSRSFIGLETIGLYLHECSLQRLSADMLTPLNNGNPNNTLQYLWLNGNELTVLEKKFLSIFSTLSHLRLGSNPLHCNCESVWLKEYYDKNAAVFEGAPAPSCLTPSKMKGSFFNNLSLFDFRCNPPVFNNIDALFEDTHARLKCTATGDPAPTLFWVQPTGENQKYPPPADSEARMNEGVLRIAAPHHQHHHGMPGEDLSGMYICLALNAAGNVTLTLNVSWPHSQGRRPHRTPEIPFIFPTSPASTEAPEKPSPRPQTTLLPSFDLEAEQADSAHYPPIKSNDHNNPLKDKPYNFTALNMLDLHRRNSDRRFNLTELVGAVIGTHVCTLLICLIFMPIYLKRQWKKRHSPHNLHTLAKNPNESLYLNGLGSVDHYMDTPTPTKRI